MNWLDKIKEEDDKEGTNLGGGIVVFGIMILIGLLIWLE